MEAPLDSLLAVTSHASPSLVEGLLGSRISVADDCSMIIMYEMGKIKCIS